MRMRYAGIGSRDTPKSLRQEISDIAFYLANGFNMILVSGGASGADSFFEEGCDAAKGRKEIWLPHRGFNGHYNDLLPSEDAYVVASRYVPHWKHCKGFARNAHARNCHQVLGADLLTPVKFVICWTPMGEVVGGTATALRIAQDHEIPILNLGTPGCDTDIISEFLERNCNER